MQTARIFATGRSQAAHMPKGCQFSGEDVYIQKVSLGDIIAELYFKPQVDSGLRELDEGKGLPHEEIQNRMAKWIIT
jgi:virulence-associated protein VagC